MGTSESARAEINATISTDSRAGKYLTFVLQNEIYGVDVLKIQEIIGILPVTAVPQTPDFVKGVINLRGKVIPIVDLRLKFGMPEVEATQETCIIVINLVDMLMGIVVDTVREVVDILDEQIEDPPRFGASVNTEFIRGMGKMEDRVTMLLDIERVLTSAEMVLVTEMAEQQ